MGRDLVEIEPGELQFTFEVKKQSSCSVHLVNKSNDYVAFKVKTTSPKRYCVRPNTGVILPRSTCDFTVTMQAQRTAPPDMQLKDKFLVQTTVVPYGTADEDIVPAFFSKETGRYIEESKLRVVLVDASQPLEEQHINGVSSAEPPVEVPVLKETLNVVNEAPNVVKEIPTPLKETPAILREIPSPLKDTSSILREVRSPLKEAPTILTDFPSPSKETTATLVDSHFPLKENIAVLKESPLPGENPAPKDVNSIDRGLLNVEDHHLSHVTEDVQNLKSKLSNLESKLEEAEKMIIKLREESKSTIQERDKLQHETVFLRRKGTSRNQSGFPLLFVVYMALLGMLLGYLLRL